MKATATKPVTNLFAASTKVKAPSSTKSDKKIIKALLGNKIQTWSDLKQKVEAQTAEMKMLEGDIKVSGKEIFMKEYLQQRSTPENFKIQDETGATCMFICMDKYTTVDETKAEFLPEGLVAEKVTYTFNADLVEKYGQVLSELISTCKQISDEDKALLISGEKTFSIKKGSIDRLLQYDSPKDVFELINPIVSLKK